MKTIEDVRDEAFSLLAALRKNEIDVSVARAGNDILRTLVDTAKVEVEYSAIHKGASQFLLDEPKKNGYIVQTASGQQEVTPIAGNSNLISHQMR